jgi:succinate-semialdehyde dehydrogenase/glutarate-semialdehyde dehydrogenase
LVQAFVDAGIPPGVINLVFGIPSEISDYLIPHPIIRKVSFTGSTAVGKKLAMLAGMHMKRMTMELGGHAPAIIAEDAQLDVAVSILSAQKFRNSGQVCTAPTRFLVQERVFDEFVDRFAAEARKLRVGDGLAPNTQMGPLAHERRLSAMEAFVADAVRRGAKIVTGGRRIGSKGYFFEPTLLTNVPREARIMNEEPFGPLAPIMRYTTLDEAIAEANRLSYGLAAYGYSKSLQTVAELGGRIEAGVVSINHNGVALPETPFGGIRDSGQGSEGGIEAVEAYLNTKFITQKMYLVHPSC